MAATALRFDICEAYLALEWDYHNGGVLWERPSNRRRNMSTDVQLGRMGFRPPLAFSGFDDLTLEGQEIYAALCERYGFPIPAYDEEREIYLRPNP